MKSLFKLVGPSGFQFQHILLGKPKIALTSETTHVVEHPLCWPAHRFQEACRLVILSTEVTGSDASQRCGEYGLGVWGLGFRVEGFRV